MSRKIYNFLLGRPQNKLTKMLSRINYAFTPLELELQELKKKHPYIKAKPYILHGFSRIEPMVVHKGTGNILLEHSANISNNHLDIIAAIKSKNLNLRERNVYVPLSYGNEKFASHVQDEAMFDGANVQCLLTTLPFEDYKKMISGCTHAIFGMLRQSGLGNIYICFRKGIKVFLFKDSMLYKQFKADGYHVFSIEDDLNDVSIKEPLTKDQTLNNYNLYYSQMHDLGTFQEQMDKILIEKKDDKH